MDNEHIEDREEQPKVVQEPPGKTGWLRRRKRWIEEWKEVIEVCSLSAGIAGVIVSILLLIAQAGDSLSLNKQLAKQTEAIWHSSRPAITIEPVSPQQDINLLTDQALALYDSIGVDTSDVYRFTFKVKNSGRSPALIDSVTSELLASSKPYVTVGPVAGKGMILSPEDRNAVPFEPLLRKSSENYLRIAVHYGWEDEVDQTRNFLFEKYYHTRYENGKWRATLICTERYLI